MLNATEITFLLTDTTAKNLLINLGIFITINCSISAIIGAIIPSLIKLLKEKAHKKKEFRGLQ